MPDPTASPSPTAGREFWASLYEDVKYGPSKNTIVVASPSAIVSMAASLLLVFVLVRSRDGLTTTYHRLLLGLSCADVLYSLSHATFGAIAPRDLNYLIWNARGTRASCDAFGFINALGGLGGLYYACSLDLYYLARIAYDRTDSDVARTVEPWLHGVPVLIGSSVGVFLLVTDGAHADVGGFCGGVPSDVPHCEGRAGGTIPEGFEDPCKGGRGSFASGVVVWILGFVILLVPPVVVGTSLVMMYRSVLTTEQRVARYGDGAPEAPVSNDARRTDDDGASADVQAGDNGGGGVLSILSAIKRRFRGAPSRTSPSSQESSPSRRMFHQAAAYPVAYFLTWSWFVIYGLVPGAGAELPAFFRHVSGLLFQPIQGLWNFLIYLHPAVVEARRSSSDRNDVSWPRAFADALRSAVDGGGARDLQDDEAIAPGTNAGPAPAAAPGAEGTDATVGADLGDNGAVRLEGEEETAGVHPRQKDHRNDNVAIPGPGDGNRCECPPTPIQPNAISSAQWQG